MMTRKLKDRALVQLVVLGLLVSGSKGEDAAVNRTLMGCNGNCTFLPPPVESMSRLLPSAAIMGNNSDTVGQQEIHPASRDVSVTQKSAKPGMLSNFMPSPFLGVIGDGPDRPMVGYGEAIPVPLPDRPPRPVTFLHPPALGQKPFPYSRPHKPQEEPPKKEGTKPQQPPSQEAAQSSITQELHEPYHGESYHSEHHHAELYHGEPHHGEPYHGEPHHGDPYDGKPHHGEPYQGQPHPGEPFVFPPHEVEVRPEVINSLDFPPPSVPNHFDHQLSNLKPVRDPPTFFPEHLVNSQLLNQLPKPSFTGEVLPKPAPPLESWGKPNKFEESILGLKAIPGFSTTTLDSQRTSSHKKEPLPGIPLNFNKFIQQHKRKMAWSGVLKFLATVVPLGLIVAALHPSVLVVNATEAPKPAIAGHHRSLEGLPDLASEECQKRRLCDILATAAKAHSLNATYRAIVNRSPEVGGGMLKEVVERAEGGRCSGYLCTFS